MKRFKYEIISYAVVLTGIFMLFAPFAIQVLPWFEWSDGCEHAAAIRELTHSLSQPKNPYLELPGNTSPRFVPSIILMALFQRFSGMDIFTVLACTSVVAFFAFGLGIYLFAREYFQDARQPLYTLPCILFLWGQGWDGANGYMFSSLVFTAYYPSVVSFIGIFYALAAFLKYMRHAGLVSLVAFIAFSSFIVLNHPLTGCLFFLMAGLLAITAHPFSRRNLYVVAVSFCIAFGLAAVWPYYSLCDSIFSVAKGSVKEFWDYRATHEYLYSSLLTRTGPGLLGIPALVYLAARRKYPFLIIGFLLYSFLYGLGYCFNISLGERGIFFCMLFSQLAFSHFLKQLGTGQYVLGKKRMDQLLRNGCGAALIFGFCIQLYLVGCVYGPEWIALQPVVQLKKYQNPLQKYFILKNHVHRGDIILTDVFTSWVLPCTTDAKVISLLHNSPLVHNNGERLQDTMLFFASPKDYKNILGKYSITHILIHKTKKPSQKENFESSFSIPNPDKKLMDELATLGRVVLDNDNFFLVKLPIPFKTLTS